MVAGLVAGAVLALAAGRLVAGLLYGIKPTDPATFAAVAGVLALVSLAACLLPGRRAARVDPLVTLRSD